MDNHKKAVGSKILSALVLLYFAALVGGLIVFSEIRPALCISVFGTLLIFIAIAIISSAVKQKVKAVQIICGIMSGFAGICMVVFPILFLYSPSFKEVDGQKLGITIVLLFVTAIGFSFLAVTLIGLVGNKSRCTYPVMAEVTDEIFQAKNRSSDLRRHRFASYRYQFRFFYNGNEYIVEDTTASNLDKLHTGQQEEIYINPDDPEIFHRRRPKMTIASIAMGIIWFAVGLGTLILYAF